MLRGLATGVIALVVAGALAVDARAETTLTLFGEKWEWVSEGRARTWFPSNTHSLELHAIEGRRDWLRFDLRGGPPEYEPFRFVFAAPHGQALAPGVYAFAQDAWSRDPDRPGISVTGDGRACNLTVGNFEVRELVWGAHGLARAWILWEQHCDPWEPAAFGELRYRMPEPAGLGIAPTVLRLPDTEPGRPGPAMPVTVQAKNGPATLAAARIVGGGGTFAIVEDGCAGVTLETQATCQVTVTTRQRSPGPRRATLLVGDSAVPLQAFQWGGVTRLDLQSDPGDFIGKGLTLSFTPADTHLGIARWDTDYVDDQGDLLVFETQHDERPWEGSLAAAHNDLLEVGRRYTPVELKSKPDRTLPGLWISPRGLGCHDVTGEFTVHRLRLDRDLVREALVSWVQHCGGAPPALRGTFQYRVGDNTAYPPWLVTQPAVTDLSAPAGAPPGPNARLPAPCRAPGFATARVRAGTRASEVLRGTAARDVLAGGGGADRLSGRRGRDCLAGQRGDDRLAGRRGADRLSGGVGRDVLRGGPGRDRLSGGAGRDVLRGGPGRDRLRCGRGRDVAVVGPGDRPARSCERLVRF